MFSAIPKYNLTSMRVIFSGAAPLSSDLVSVVRKRFQSVGANVIISQGERDLGVYNPPTGRES